MQCRKDVIHHIIILFAEIRRIEVNVLFNWVYMHPKFDRSVFFDQAKSKLRHH